MRNDNIKKEKILKKEMTINISRVEYEKKLTKINAESKGSKHILNEGDFYAV